MICRQRKRRRARGVTSKRLLRVSDADAAAPNFEFILKQSLDEEGNELCEVRRLLENRGGMGRWK